MVRSRTPLAAGIDERPGGCFCKLASSRFYSFYNCSSKPTTIQADRYRERVFLLRVYVRIAGEYIEVSCNARGIGVTFDTRTILEKHIL